MRRRKKIRAKQKNKNIRLRSIFFFFFRGGLQSALEHRRSRHAALRRMAELQEGEDTFKREQLECQKEAWEVERGLQVRCAHIKQITI